MMAGKAEHHEQSDIPGQAGEQDETQLDESLAVAEEAARSGFANPLEFPLAAAIGIGIIVYAFSRIMLWLSKTNTVIAFLP